VPESRISPMGNVSLFRLNSFWKHSGISSKWIETWNLRNLENRGFRNSFNVKTGCRKWKSRIMSGIEFNSKIPQMSSRMRSDWCSPRMSIFGGYSGENIHFRSFFSETPLLLIEFFVFYFPIKLSIDSTWLHKEK
jgi:hypothetical protein